MSASQQQPNILLFVSDQQHYTCCPGSCEENLAIPNMEWLAERGTVFQRAYCTSPLCTPARASLLTGRMPADVGMVANYEPGEPLYAYDGQFETIGSRLTALGYETAYSGKWHLPTGSERRGFGTVLGRLTQWDIDRPEDDDAVRQAAALGVEIGTTYRSYLRNSAGVGEPAAFHGRTMRLPLNAHPGVQMAQLSSAWIRGHGRGNKPFFLTYSCIEPHPLGMRYDIVPAPFDRMYHGSDFTLPESLREDVYSALRRRGYDGGLTSAEGLCDDEVRGLIAAYMGAVSYTDFVLGILLEALAASGELDNTVIIFTSDHGEMLGRHGLFKKGAVMYEDLIRIPLIVAHGGGRYPARTEVGLASHLDLLPSLLELGGGDGSRTPCGGISLVPTLDGRQPLPKRKLSVEYTCTTWGDPKTPLHAQVEDEWKLISTPDGPIARYNLNDDPCEMHNRIEESRD